MNACINSSNIWPPQKLYQRTQSLPPFIPYHVIQLLKQSFPSTISIFLCSHLFSFPLFLWALQWSSPYPLWCWNETCTKLALSKGTHVPVVPNGNQNEIKSGHCNKRCFPKDSCVTKLLHNSSSYLSLCAARDSVSNAQQVLHFHEGEQKESSKINSCKYIQTSESYFFIYFFKTL